MWNKRGAGIDALREERFSARRCRYGKTEVINAFIETNPEGIVRLAPTGLAARNLKSGGMTIHRFLKMLERNQQVSPSVPDPIWKAFPT